jgi:hypothetical protein
MSDAILESMLQSPMLPELSGDEYSPVEVQADGLLCSDVVPGFAIPVRAIFDEEINSQVMRQIWAGQ